MVEIAAPTAVQQVGFVRRTADELANAAGAGTVKVRAFGTVPCLHEHHMFCHEVVLSARAADGAVFSLHAVEGVRWSLTVSAGRPFGVLL